MPGLTILLFFWASFISIASHLCNQAPSFGPTPGFFPSHWLLPFQKKVLHSLGAAVLKRSEPDPITPLPKYTTTTVLQHFWEHPWTISAGPVVATSLLHLISLGGDFRYSILIQGIPDFGIPIHAILDWVVIPVCYKPAWTLAPLLSNTPSYTYSFLFYSSTLLLCIYDLYHTTRHNDTLIRDFAPRRRSVHLSRRRLANRALQPPQPR